MSDPLRPAAGVSTGEPWAPASTPIEARQNRNVAPPVPAPGQLDPSAGRPLHLSIPLITGPRRDSTMGLPAPGSPTPRGPAPSPQTTGSLTITVNLTAADGTFRWGAGDVLMGNDIDMAMPEIPETAPPNADGTPGRSAEGLQRRAVRFAYTRAVLPNGVEVSQGTGKLTLLHDGAQIVGVLKGSVELDAGATTVVRAKDGPVALSGHRGEPGELRYGGAMVRDGRLVGLAANSEATVDGLRVQTQDREATYKLEPPGAYTLGKGMLVRELPADRSVTLSGEGVDVFTGETRTHVVRGGVEVRGGREVVPLEGAEVRVLRDAADPRPDDEHAVRMPVGGIILRPSAVDGRLFVDGASPYDFTQGALGDCFLLGSLMAVAHFRPQLIEQMVRDNGDGTYSVRFYQAGLPVTRTVDADQYFATAPYRYQIYARSKLAHELWAPVVEKAYASLREQGYHSLDEGGYAGLTLTQLTNAPTERFTTLTSPADRMFSALRAAVIQRRPTVAAVHRPEPNADAALRELGLLNHHAYAVLDAYEEAGRRFVVLRNPWGTMDFKASGYESDVDVDGDGRLEGVDGTFRMTIEDFQRYFAQVDVLQL